MGVSWRKQTLENCKYLSELFAQTVYKQLWDYKIKNQPPSLSQVDFPQTVRLISLDCKKNIYIYTHTHNSLLCKGNSIILESLYDNILLKYLPLHYSLENNII